MQLSPVGSYTRRILRWIDRATPEQAAEGMDWYATARTFAADLAEGTDYTMEQVAGVIAVLSPQCSWEINMRAAEGAVRAHQIGRTTLLDYPGYKINARKALAILAGDLSQVRGPKVTAFYDGIRGDLSTPVLDIWAMRAARDAETTLARVYRQDEMPNMRERRVVEEAYRRAAAHRGIAPGQAQAIAWVVIRTSGRFDRMSHSPGFYARQNAARNRQGLTIHSGDYAWGANATGQAAAKNAFETAGIH